MDDTILVDLDSSNILIGKKIYHYKKIPSTQKLAISIAHDDLSNNTNINNGTVILADEQTEGKGRKDRKWISPQGGLWFSLILKPSISPNRSLILQILSTISVCSAINKFLNIYSTIKWPNDIVLNGKKISGSILDISLSSSSNIDYAVIGIGINVDSDVNYIKNLIKAQHNFQDITSIQNELNYQNIDKMSLLKVVLEELEYNLFLVEKEFKYNQIIKNYKKLCDTLGKRIYVYQNEIQKYPAIAKDIDNDGSLIIEKEGNTPGKIYFEEVSIREVL